MDLKFQCLSTAVSLMSEEAFQKVLAIRQRQLEKTRISEYVAGSNNRQLKSAADKIKVISAPEPQGSDWKQVKEADLWLAGTHHYCFCARKYAIGPEEFPLHISTLTNQCSFDDWHKICGWELTYKISVTYKESSGCSSIHYVTHGCYSRQSEQNNGVKTILRLLAADLGMEGDKDLLALMELLFGELVVFKLHLKGRDLAGNTFARIVIDGESIEEEDDC
jgi:hypothetical protein